MACDTNIVKMSRLSDFGTCDLLSLHAESSYESVGKYVDVQSQYLYICKNKHYAVGHPRCLVGPALQKFGTDFTKFEGIFNCSVLSPRGLHIPLLPTSTTKLMFVLCKTCAEAKNLGRCTYSTHQRSLTAWHLGDHRIARSRIGGICNSHNL